MRAILDDDKLRRVVHPIANEYGDPYNGAAIMRTATGAVRILFSDGEGWDHVSVSRTDRCPTWDEMCAVKERFFDPEDVVVQLHPARSKYVNVHNYCLHLWRLQDGEFPLPDPAMVG